MKETNVLKSVEIVDLHENRSQYYENESMADLRWWVTQLNNGLSTNEFFLEYQPQFDFQTGSIQGMEALVRWNSACMGLVPPVSFIHLAEETGKILTLGEWVFLQVCRQRKAWTDMGIPELPVSVNVSVRQLEHVQFADRMKEILLETRVMPNNIKLEITESLAIRECHRVRYALDMLGEMGVRWSIDDFGKGYSALNCLLKLPVHEFKVDPCLTGEIVHASGLMMIESLLELARKLNLEVVLEGVESMEEALQIPQWFKGRVQGYLYSRPLREPELTSYLLRHFSGLYRIH